MLNKLLKYDLKWIYKLIIVFYILAVGFAVLTRVFYSFDNSLLAQILAEICNGTVIALMISAVVNTLMRSWVHFRRNLYGDESYLTHTLPVEKRTIYLAKVLAAVLVALTTLLVAGVCLFIAYYSPENWEVLRQFLTTTAAIYDTNTLSLLLIVAAVVFVELIFILLCGYVGIILGHRSNQNKMAKSIALGFATYAVAQVVTLVIILVLGVFIPEVGGVINGGEMIGTGALKTLLAVAVIIYTFYDVFLYFAGQKLLDKGVNVD